MVGPIPWISASGRKLFSKGRTPASYAIVFLLLVATYPLARWTGTKQTERDLCRETSTLPHLIFMKLDTEQIEDTAGYRVLALGGEHVVICSAATRRTGVFCAAHAVVSQGGCA